jgi:hypothetical protein
VDVCAKSDNVQESVTIGNGQTKNTGIYIDMWTKEKW